MIVSPISFDAPDSYRVAVLRKRISPEENRQRFAKQHRNNAAGKVFAATIMPADADAGSATALSTTTKQKGRE
jgi:hypothetical protein